MSQPDTRTVATEILTFSVDTDSDGAWDSIYDNLSADEQAVYDSYTVLRVDIIPEAAIEIRGTQTNGQDAIDIAADDKWDFPLGNALKKIEFRTDGGTAAATTVQVVVFAF